MILVTRGCSSVETVFSPRLLIVLVAAGLIVTGVSGQVAVGDDPLEAVSIPSSGEIDLSGSEINESRVEQLVFEKLNERRTQRDYPALQYNQRAAEEARLPASDMAANDYFSHTDQDGETVQQRYVFCTGGENIYQTWVNKRVDTAEGMERFTDEEELAEGIVTGWMSSRPHREDGIYGELWQSGAAGVSITNEGKVYAVFGFCA